MKTSRIISAILALVLTGAALLAGCGSDDSDDASGAGGGVEVVATTMQLQDFARQVGGERVDVTGVLGPDDEPHEYEP
nr:zinc ABC transporter substrate-binding protein [Thermoleophilaceae bacterium]